MKYRPEIDGLRAIAVLPVILFHAGISGFQGGFVGVDIFFAISGFLITGIILDEIDQNRFSVLSFYERRARRILPALFFVIIICIPFAWYLLSPNDLKEFAQSIFAIMIFGSNFLFWQRSGYFDTEAELTPMLHTWSLAVEEQFYVLFPLIVIAFATFSRNRLFFATAFLALVSLALAEWQAHADPVTAFFLLPARAWEMLIGALAAMAMRRWRPKELLDARAPLANEALGLLGLGMIVTAISLFTADMTFPGLSALVPVVGATLLIMFSGPETLAGRILSWRPFVAIGLISYSAYLWHHPIFAFARHASLDEVSTTALLALSALSLVLAWLSWRLVEQPFRRPAVFGRNAIFAFSAAGIALFGSLGLTVHFNETRITALRLGAVDPETRDAFRDKDDLHAEREAAFKPFQTAARSPFEENGTRRLLILGDSVSNDLHSSLMLTADSHQGLQFRRLPLDETCMAFFAEFLAGMPTVDPPRLCTEELNVLKTSPLFETADEIVLNAFWTRTTTDTSHSGAMKLASEIANSGKTVWIVGLLSIKEGPSLSFTGLTRGLSNDQMNHIAYKTLRHNRTFEANLDTSKLSRSSDHIRFLNKQELFCDMKSARCSLYDEKGNLNFSDGHHVSLSGALYFGRRMAELGWFR
jgi:peptidoglycan/LPS O-acetylase OafA/YrhL